MDLKCFFYFDYIEGFFSRNIYSCSILPNAVLSNSREIKSISGEHIEGKCHDNVAAVCFSSRTLVGFPKNLPAIFPHLMRLELWGCGLTELTREDLAPLNQLQVLSITDNFLTSLPNDLFMESPNLRILLFRCIGIKKLSSKILNHLNWNIIKKIYLRDSVVFERIPELSNQNRHHVTISSFRAAIDQHFLHNDNEQEKKLSELFVSGEGSDFSILVDDVQLRVHKRVLAHHSSVFQAMFSHEMEESRVSEMTITDFSAEVVQEMVRFIYTGNVSHLDSVVELYAISNKYFIIGLKQLCQETIIDALDESNICEVLRIGIMYSDRMKQAAFKYISEKFSKKELDPKLIDHPDQLEQLVQLKLQHDNVSAQLKRQHDDDLDQLRTQYAIDLAQLNRQYTIGWAQLNRQFDAHYIKIVSKVNGKDEDETTKDRFSSLT